MADGVLDDAELEGPEGDKARDAKPEGHVIVNADHIGPEALIDRAHAGPGDAGAVTSVRRAVKVRH
jgi:hypothetical protein